MFLGQAGLCYLCGLPLGLKSQIAIDHDHGCCQPDAGGHSRTCGYCRRGLAHGNCNAAIGMAGDNPGLLRKMADNLEHAQAITAALRITKPEQGELLGEDIA